MALVNDTTSESAAELALLGNILAFSFDTSVVARAVSSLEVVGFVGVPEGKVVGDRVDRNSRDGQGDRGEHGQKGGELHFI